ncbi:hypothetical protein D3C86_1934410 [compost metagenome]
MFTAPATGVKVNEASTFEATKVFGFTSSSQLVSVPNAKASIRYTLLFIFIFRFIFFGFFG